MFVFVCSVCRRLRAPQNAATAQERDQADGAYAVITDDMGPERTAGREAYTRRRPVYVLAEYGRRPRRRAGRPGDGQAEDAELPERYAAVPDVGPVYNVSVEKSWSFSPI